MLTNEPWSETNRVWLAEGTYASPFRRTTRFSTSTSTATGRRTTHRHRDAPHDLGDEVVVVVLEHVVRGDGPVPTARHFAP